MATHELDTFTLFDANPPCSAHDFFGHSTLPELPPIAYQSLFEPPDDWWPMPETLTFSVPSLNLAAACIRKYLQGGTDWFHLQIPAVSFHAFYQAMETDYPHTVLLPFWCWCDSGSCPETSRRQHRHVIAVSPVGHFKLNVWKKMKPGIQRIRIKSPRHLLNTLGHVSDRYSDRTFSGHVHTRCNHFCINIPLPKNFQWVLAGCWKTGFLQVIHQACEQVRPEVLAPFAQCIDGSWKVYVKHVPNIPMNLVLPVSNHFFPTNRPTDYVVYLTLNRTLYFEKKQCALDHSEWGRIQANSGNIFCNSIENEWITLSKYQQDYLNRILAE